MKARVRRGFQIDLPGNRTVCAAEILEVISGTDHGAKYCVVITRPARNKKDGIFKTAFGLSEEAAGALAAVLVKLLGEAQPEKK